MVSWIAHLVMGLLKTTLFPLHQTVLIIINLLLFPHSRLSFFIPFFSLYLFVSRSFVYQFQWVFSVCFRNKSFLSAKCRTRKKQWPTMLLHFLYSDFFTLAGQHQSKKKWNWNKKTIEMAITGNNTHIQILNKIRE